MSESQRSLPLEPAAPRRASIRAGRGRKSTLKGSRRKGSAASPKSAGPARAPEKRARGSRNSEGSSAEQMAHRQRDISVSEFFAKNRHLLGFDNPAKALLTTVKELVDNALDASDEARLPAEVEIRIDQLAEDRFRVICTDHGPGIVARNVPSVFGKLLFGSKFHRLKMSRGQQGIGVSAAGMYGLLTTGHPVRVISRPSAKKPAHRFEIAIDTQKNRPAVKQDDEVEWELEHGTRVEIELEASYRKGQHSADAYILQISLANPHATIRYLGPGRENDESPTVYERVTTELPPETAEIKPHPYGVELGILMQLLRESKNRNLSGLLVSQFSRVTTRTANEICKAAGISSSRRPTAMDRAEAEALHRGIAKSKIMAPPTDCIAPIGEELLARALSTIHACDFQTAVTRRPAVYRGNPFLIEVALAWGGELSAEDPATVYRYANRVPLQYQQGACAITRAVSMTDWKKYGLQQPRGAAPLGPVVVMVHIASVWVPFTSESKEAIAHYPEIIREIKLALQDCGRRLGQHLRRRRREADEVKMQDYIKKYIPHVVQALKAILDLSDKETQQTVVTLTQILERSRKL